MSNQMLVNQIVSVSPKGIALSTESENGKSKLKQSCSIKKAWNKVKKKFNTIAVNNETVCVDFDDKRRRNLFIAENDSRGRPVRLKFKTGRIPGVTGLRNHGNTCFINAVLQCLAHIDCLAKYFVMNQYKADLTRRNKLTSYMFGTKGEVTEQLALLLKSIWYCQYDPDISKKFKLIIEKYGAQYSDSNQHDAQEFLVWLLDKMHEDLNTASKKHFTVNTSFFDRPDTEVAKKTLANHVRCNNSFIHDVFQAQFRSSLTCLSCQKQSNTFDPFLCVSVPIPQNEKRPVYVTVLYKSQKPRQVKLGLFLNENSTVSELRKELSSETGIPESRILLTQIDDLGFQRTFSSRLPISEIEETDPVYCIEMPHLKAKKMEKYILLCWVNVLTTDNHCSRFGSPYTMKLRRLTRYPNLQWLMLKNMNMILHDKILNDEQNLSLFRIKIVGGVSLESSPLYLRPTVDYPLYMEEIDQALAVLDEDSGPRHVKLVLGWGLPAKESIVTIDNDLIEEHPSVKRLRSQFVQRNFVTLEECFELYTKAEVLSAEDKWHCPSCNRKQDVIKKLDLWSLPDIFVIHLMRFRQQSYKNQLATKIMTPVEFPVRGFDMNIYLVDPSRDISTSLALWGPWSKSKRTVSPDDDVYDLCAICNHHGEDLQKGHYTAFCLNTYDGQWYSFDDTKVKPIPETHLITSSAYVLFYQRRSLRNFNCSSRFSSVSSAEHWVSRMPAFHYSGKKVNSQDEMNEEKKRFNSSTKGNSFERNQSANISVSLEVKNGSKSNT